MSEVLPSIEVCGRSDVERLIDEVAEAGEPRYLAKNGEPYALIVPLRKGALQQHWTEEEYEAFLSSAGSWADFNADTFLAENRKSRDMSSRPPVDL
jgi:antitoxin (DNA-binding transcriptional repressor) of toxin-antitoxin stability system